MSHEWYKPKRLASTDPNWVCSRCGAKATGPYSKPGKDSLVVIYDYDFKFSYFGEPARWSFKDAYTCDDYAIVSIMHS